MKLAEVNLNDLDTFEAGTPHEQFRVLRNEAPVYHHPGPVGDSDYWCITKHADLKHISKNPKVFSSEEKSAILRDPDPAGLEMMRLIMLNMDPPKHRQYRAIVNKAFTPRMVAGLEAAVDRMVDDIIDSVCETGQCDFVDQLAAPLPMAVICEMMGVPEEDRRAIYDLGNRMIAFDDPDFTSEEEAAQANLGTTEGAEASAEMFLYAAKLAEKARTHPSDDLATALLNAEVDGHKLSEMEFNSFFLLLAVAGNETTRTVTTNGMWDLIRYPDQRQRVLDDPSLLNSMVEEVLRFNPAVHVFRRQVMEDTEVRGVKLPAGEKIALWYPAVNRDEDVFSDPDVFDVGRTPNDHLSFGVGEHFCLGSNLARMELRKIFGGLLSRLPDIELAAEPRRLRSNFINGVKEMQVTFSPSAPKRKAA
jgi:cholest-4-en-3-one 26-monooxygenase